MNTKKIGENLAALMKARHISQSELSKTTGRIRHRNRRRYVKRGRKVSLKWHKYISLTRYEDHSPVIVRCDLIKDIEAVNSRRTKITYKRMQIEVVESLIEISDKTENSIPVRKARINRLEKEGVLVG